MRRFAAFAFLAVAFLATPSFAQDKATQQFTLTVNAGTLAFSTTALPHATVGAAYVQPINVSGGIAPYTFSVSVGSLPAGVTLSPAGALSGTPTATGTVNFTVQVKDSESPAASATQAFSILVINPLTITTTSLPAANAGVAYSATINISGGVPPYTCSVSVGALPAGLTLGTTGVSSCPISGTPTADGSFTFTIQVVDSLSAGAMLTKPQDHLIAPPTLNGNK